MVASKHMEERVYPSVLSGKLRIDDQGRLWRGDRRAENDIGKYLQVRVMRDGVRYHALAHRLVWLHFKGPIPGQIQINHKDGNGKNNRLENLELATASENLRHAYGIGRLNQWGERNHRSKLTARQVAEIRSRRRNEESLASIAQDYGVAFQTISKIARGQRWPGR